MKPTDTTHLRVTDGVLFDLVKQLNKKLDRPEDMYIGGRYAKGHIKIIRTDLGNRLEEVTRTTGATKILTHYMTNRETYYWIHGALTIKDLQK